MVVMLWVPQKALEADVAWQVSRDTSADSLRQPLEPVSSADRTKCWEQQTTTCLQSFDHL